MTIRWRDLALCRDEDAELFFPIGTTGAALAQLEQAKDVCRRCAVRCECLDEAQETESEAGVWGGLSEDERRELKRQTGRPVRTS
jgi:WhiB family redox-sensing transcriptional regulator